jgi:CRISPR system Cascade subunit CasD
MNTVFLRLESHLQSYANNIKFSEIKTNLYPTKSAVIGMLLAAFGICREESRSALTHLNKLQMGVRVDRPGRILEDFQTVRPELMLANGNTREMGDITYRSYLEEAVFLVALRGESAQIEECVKALKNPNFPLYLGRSFCIPYDNLYYGDGEFPSLEEALCSIPAYHSSLLAILEDLPSLEAEMSHDVLLDCRNQLTHGGRYVKKKIITVPVIEKPVVEREAKKKINATARSARFKHDGYLCVVCKMRAKECHHVTYARAGNEKLEDLRSLCEACHTAVTSLEYTLGMHEPRIDPLDRNWNNKIRALRCNHA